MNDQEKLWAGEFGNAYHDRNNPQHRLDFWSNALKKTMLGMRGVTELGAGKGDNLVALRCLIPGAKFIGIEVNHKACVVMKRRKLSVIESTLSGLANIPLSDLVITSGLLIHIPESQLPHVLAMMFHGTTKYICIAEYFSPVRREVNYRGYTSALWTDDYARRLMEQFPNRLKLLDYGFVYHTDGADDLTWFLLEKKSGSVDRSLLK